MSAIKNLLEDEARMEKHGVTADQVEFVIVLNDKVQVWLATGGKDDKIQKEILKSLDSWTYARLPYAIKNYPFVTSHKLKMFNRNPYLANEIYNNLIPSCKEDDKDYFKVGLAVDTFCTYGRKELETRFTVKNKPDAAFKQEAQEKNQMILTESIGAQVEECIQEYKSRHFFPPSLLKKNIIAVIEGLPVKVEVDDWRPEEMRFGDLKTNKNVNTFITDGGWKTYLFQQQVYYRVIIHEGIRNLNEEQIEDLRRKLEGYLYVVDKYGDFSRSHCFIFSPQTLKDGWDEVTRLLEKWKKSVDSGIWEWTFDLDNIDDLKMFNDCELYPILGEFKNLVKPTII